jgi:hypothetical protein
VVRKESRRRVTEVGVVPDLGFVFSSLLERVDHPLLNRIDPYGYRELGSVDMSDFVAALDAVGAEGRHFDDLRALAAVRGGPVADDGVPGRLTWLVRHP